MTTWAQRSFAGGEISPSLYGRVDQVKYQNGLRTCRNFLIQRHGGAASRPGTSFIGEVKFSSAQVRLIPFIFNADQTYMLEFGNQYMRVIHNAEYVVGANVTISNITQGNPAVVTATSHGYSSGDEIQMSSVVGMTALNNRNFKVITLDANHFQLYQMDGVTPFDSTSLSAYTSGGIANRVYEISTPYLTAELSALKFVQSGDVITIVHQNHAPAQLSRLAHDNWTLANISFGPDFSGIITGAFNFGLNYPSTESGINVSAINLTTNITITTSTAHGYNNGEKVLLSGLGGSTQLNGGQYYVKNATSTTFQLANQDGVLYSSSGISAFTSGGTSQRIWDAYNYSYIITLVNPTTGEEGVPLKYLSTATDLGHSVRKLTQTESLNITPGVVNTYNIYRQENGVYGFIGQIDPTLNQVDFTDIGTDPDFTKQPPRDPGYFQSAGNYPATVNYFQQRLSFANSINEPEAGWMSQSGHFKNFLIHKPLQDDDAIKFSMAGKQVNQIQDLVDLGQLVIMTSGGEHSANGNGDGVITPSAINLKQHSYCGSSSLSPLVIGANALFVQARGSAVRDLAFDWQVDGYRGNDLTIFAAHLFDNYTLVDWTYSQIPHSIVWAARSDGTLLGLTYIREQQIWAWHHHDFDGTVENVCSIPEGNEDVLYLVIKRTINGQTKRYIERMATRQISDVIDFIGLDASLTYDGRNTGSTTMTLSGSGWTHSDLLTLTASASFFSTSDVGNEIQLTGSDGTLIRFEITNYISATQVSGHPNKNVPVSMQAVAILDWAKAVDQLSGLWHLEGKQVSIFADGFVVANPNNPDYESYTVSNGALNLSRPFGVIHVGLPFTCDVETLDIDTANGESVANKKKIVTRVTVQVEKSRGLWVGPSAPSTDALDDLQELKIRQYEDYDDPIELADDRVQVNIRPEWNSNGRVFIRQSDPLPLSVLSIIPDGLVPFKGSGG